MNRDNNTQLRHERILYIANIAVLDLNIPQCIFYNPNESDLRFHSVYIIIKSTFNMKTKALKAMSIFVIGIHKAPKRRKKVKQGIRQLL